MSQLGLFQFSFFFFVFSFLSDLIISKTLIKIENLKRKKLFNLITTDHNFKCCTTGRVEEWSPCSADTTKQHNGINIISINGNHAELSDRNFDDKQRRRPINLVYVWRQKRFLLLHKIFLHIGMLPGSVPAQRSINQILQPRRHFDQCALQENVRKRASSSAHS